MPDGILLAVAQVFSLDDLVDGPVTADGLERLQLLSARRDGLRRGQPADSDGGTAISNDRVLFTFYNR